MIKHLKKYKFASLLMLLFAFGCNDFLEVESLTKMSPDRLLSDEKGLKTVLANLYNGVPMEDFAYRPNIGFNRRGWGEGLQVTLRSSHFTDESVLSQGSGLGPCTFNYWEGGTANEGNSGGFRSNREVAIFLKSILQAKNQGIIAEDVYNRLWSEAHFIRAYVYYGLAKRYGGVPIISWLQDDDYTGDPAPLFIPRSTESDTWKFILAECDSAAMYLPLPENFASGDGNPMYRANKWTAYALKSRAALHAASLAKYWDKAPLGGEAVDQKLAKMEPADASFFYGECLSASKQIIDNAPYSLYMPNPANAEEAAKNYQNLFMNTPAGEIIFAKTYMENSFPNQGHNYDNFYKPSQASTGFHKWGRFSPALDLVDLYEDYTDDGTGKSAAIKTRTDGIEDQYFGTNNPPSDQVAAIPFIKYDDPYEPFKNKDARLHGSIIVPGATFEGVTIVMQGGLIRKDGTLLIYQSASSAGDDGVTYYTYGAASSAGYSGFATMTSGDDANFSSTGFSVRKYLAEGKQIPGVENSSSTPWIDFRLAEIYLNYAEAVVESGTGDQALAARLMNDLRRRAAHKDNIPLTLDNVLKERRIEMAFEGMRIADMFRRREYHTFFTNGRRHALVQLIDLREPKPKYVFLRMDQFHDVQSGGRTFQTMNYYNGIPGTAVNKLVNNPGR
ncbi:MAG: RagB/SusD family nutrient uptake outer membrane protein [Dysgonamonadaceae bacterium]|jgi:hypothetical protein|nr:RagB/SusD family nutrient uptake outer membrane protein [Dysgonamonadaceae bacterium]